MRFGRYSDEFPGLAPHRRRASLWVITSYAPRLDFVDAPMCRDVPVLISSC